VRFSQPGGILPREREQRGREREERLNSRVAELVRRSRPTHLLSAVDTRSIAMPADTLASNVPACTLPTLWGTFQLHVFADEAARKEHVALTLGNLPTRAAVLLRIHSECLTGDTLFSLRCDCGTQLREALQAIAAEGRGVLLYLRQEGRGIGLDSKIKAYALQETGLDTVAANQALGYAADERNYAMCGPMLRYLGVSSVRLMTNNPQKIAALRNCGVGVTRIPIASVRTSHNGQYLHTKRTKLGHLAPR
jgi:GTP cyclohydrolase II